jgi:aminoglycoside 6'-N-acetyltransferase I
MAVDIRRATTGVSPARIGASSLECSSAEISDMPLINFVAETRDGTLVGFAEGDLRSHADGCDPASPVGYLEDGTWLRITGIGARFLVSAEEWAGSLGCAEVASDAWIDSDISQRSHEALGFEVVGPCVHYRKTL